MDYEYTDKCVTPWDGMVPMKQLPDKTGIRKILEELGFAEDRCNHRIHAVSMVESFG